MYNLTYVLYMTGFMSRSINFTLLFVFILVCMIEYMLKNDWVLGRQGDLFWPEFRKAMVIVFAFFLISISIQIWHGDVQLYLYTELLYNIIPPLLAFFWINTSYVTERYTYFIIFLLRYTSYFFIADFHNLSLSNIFMISWDDSKSSVFETPYAHDLFFMEIIFLYFGKKKLAFFSMLLCMLYFKRISFILSIVVYVVYILLINRKYFGKMFNKWQPVKKFIRYAVFIAMCIMPFFINWVVSDAGILFFRKRFDLNLNEFTTGRIGVIKYTIANIGHFNGYGSSDHFLTTSRLEVYRKLGSMHCDILKLYLETTIVGVVVYIYEMVEIAKKNWLIFIMLMYIFIELIASHFLDCIGLFNMFFMFAAMVYAEKHTVLHSEITR